MIRSCRWPQYSGGPGAQLSATSAQRRNHTIESHQVLGSSAGSRRSFERTDRPVDALGRRAVFLPLFRHLVLVSLLARAAHDEKVATIQQHLLTCNILRAYLGTAHAVARVRSGVRSMIVWLLGGATYQLLVLLFKGLKSLGGGRQRFGTLQ